MFEIMNRKSYIQGNPEQEHLFSFSELEIRNVLPKQSQFKALAQKNYQDFWQLWESYQDYFYNLSLKWMGGNFHDAEDALNQAMLKAWNEWTKDPRKIIHPKAWLTRLIYNFCMDVHRKHKREAPGIENIDDIKFADHAAFASTVEFPESNILNLEMRAYLHHRIESLPDKLRHPFILHHCQDKSYQDIAKQLTLSEENVRKRIQQARRILKKQLKKYLAGEDNTSLDTLFPSLKLVIPLGEKSQPECNWQSSIPTKSNHEEINYKVTVICLETLPQNCSSSPNLLGWR